MIKRYLYLDTFALVKVASDVTLSSATKAYIENNGLDPCAWRHEPHGRVVSWRKRWSEVVEFISSVPFCVAKNTDRITEREVECYPKELTSLPVGFCSSDHAFSVDELKDALSLHLRGKVADFARDFRNNNESVFRTVVGKVPSFLPERSDRYSAVEREMFMQSSVLSMLSPEYLDFLKQELAASQRNGRQDGIIIQRFKSVYIQAAAIFIEYYVQKKAGKTSDMADILQLSLVPYVDMAVLDIERTNFIQRFNRDQLFPSPLKACSLSDFKALIRE
jgi:hypothetical protein